MKITVLFFAYLKDKAGIDRELLDVKSGITVRELKLDIRKQNKELDKLLDQVIVSVNQEFASDSVVLTENAEVAFFPPVSGGSQDDNILTVTYDPINIDEIIRKLVQATTGGIAVFIGVVREITGDADPVKTTLLAYEAYEKMACKKISQVSEEIAERWPKVERIAIIQRLGKLDPGVASVIVACAGAHRDDGIFSAARYGIDRIKEIVPIWKKEFHENDEDWVVGDYFPKPGE